MMKDKIVEINSFEELYRLLNVTIPYGDKVTFCLSLLDQYSRIKMQHNETGEIWMPASDPSHEFNPSEESVGGDFTNKIIARLYFAVISSNMAIIKHNGTTYSITASIRDDIMHQMMLGIDRIGEIIHRKIHSNLYENNILITKEELDVLLGKEDAGNE